MFTRSSTYLVLTRRRKTWIRKKPVVPAPIGKKSKSDPPKDSETRATPLKFSSKAGQSNPQTYWKRSPFAERVESSNITSPKQLQESFQKFVENQKHISERRGSPSPGQSPMNMPLSSSPKPFRFVLVASNLTFFFWIFCALLKNFTSGIVAELRPFLV